MGFWYKYAKTSLMKHTTTYYAPLEKRGLIVLQLSVGRSDQVSAQYLLTPSLNQCRTWCRGCPQLVDDIY